MEARALQQQVQHVPKVGLPGLQQQQQLLHMAFAQPTSLATLDQETQATTSDATAQSSHGQAIETDQQAGRPESSLDTKAQHVGNSIGKLPLLWDPALQQGLVDTYRGATPAQQQAFISHRDAALKMSPPTSSQRVTVSHTIVLSHFEIGQTEQCTRIESSHSKFDAAVEAAKSVVGPKSPRLQYRPLRIEQSVNGVRYLVQQLASDPQLNKEKDMVVACIYTTVYALTRETWLPRA